MLLQPGMMNILVLGGDFFLGLGCGTVYLFDFFCSFPDSLCHKLGYASVA
jgi:hypothetical protein